MEPNLSVGSVIGPHGLPHVIYVGMFSLLKAGSEIRKIVPLGLC